MYIYILEFSCRYPSTDDRLVAWIVQLHSSVCCLALLAMSVFCSKCPAKVSREVAVSGSLGRQVGSGMAVLRALGRQVGPVMAIVGALGRQGGPGMASWAQNKSFHSRRSEASCRNFV